MSVADQVVAHLRHDLTAAGVTLAHRLEVTDGVVVFSTADGAAFYEVDDDEPMPPQLAEIADNIQDDLGDQYNLVIWPPCPGHPHPAVVRRDPPDAPTWACPKTGTIIAEIGALPSTSA
jgi:hypothetical protein